MKPFPWRNLHLFGVDGSYRGKLVDLVEAYCADMGDEDPNWGNNVLSRLLTDSEGNVTEIISGFELRYRDSRGFAIAPLPEIDWTGYQSLFRDAASALFA